MTEPLRSALCLSSSFEECHFNKIHVQLKLFEKNQYIVFFFPETQSVLALQAGCQHPALCFRVRAGLRRAAQPGQ